MLRGAVVSGVLMLMVLGPTAALDERRPAMLGWQMYSSVTYFPVIEVEKADGTREERQLGNVVSGVRPEVDYFERIPPFLCAKETGVVRVHLKREHPKREASAECSQF
jgi:hypothetical protein